MLNKLRNNIGAIIFIAILGLVLMGATYVNLGPTSYINGDIGVPSDGGYFFDGAIKIRNNSNTLEARNAADDAYVDFRALSLYGDGSNLTNVGAAEATALTIDAKVNEAGGITKGQPVYFSGAVGQIPQASLADNTVDGKTRVAGIAAETKTDGQAILIRVGGQLDNVNTSAYSDGDCLYLSTAGSYSTTAPTSGAIIIVVGVEYSHASQGKLLLLNHRTKDKGAPADTDLVIRLGDNAGVNKISIRDYANNEIAYIDSDGNIDGTALTIDTALLPAEGGTGVANNAANTLTFTGNYSLGLTLTANTSVTAPTSGTLYGTKADSITSANLLSSMSDETGTGKLVFGTTPTLTTPVLGAATATSIDLTATDTNYILLPLKDDAATPTLAFGDGDTGFYERVNDAMAVSLGGTQRWIFGATYIESSTNLGFHLDLAASSSTNPSFTFVGDTDTGIGRNAADQLSLTAGGVEVVRVTQNDAATDVLSVNGNVTANMYIRTVITIGDTDLTPDVSGGDVFVSQANTNPTAITDVDNPTVGQIFTIVCGNAGNPPTIADGGNFKVSAAWNSTIDDSITFFVKADNYYIELSRSVN